MDENAFDVVVGIDANVCLVRSDHSVSALFVGEKGYPINPIFGVETEWDPCTTGPRNQRLYSEMWAFIAEWRLKRDKTRRGIVEAIL